MGATHGKTLGGRFRAAAAGNLRPDVLSRDSFSRAKNNRRRPSSSCRGLCRAFLYCPRPVAAAVASAARRFMAH